MLSDGERERHGGEVHLITPRGHAALFYIQQNRDGKHEKSLHPASRQQQQEEHKTSQQNNLKSNDVELNIRKKL